MSLTSLPSEGPHAVRVCREWNPDRLIHIQPTTSTPQWRASSLKPSVCVLQVHVTTSVLILWILFICQFIRFSSKSSFQRNEIQCYKRIKIFMIFLQNVDQMDAEDESDRTAREQMEPETEIGDRHIDNADFGEETNVNGKTSNLMSEMDVESAQDCESGKTIESSGDKNVESESRNMSDSEGDTIESRTTKVDDAVTSAQADENMSSPVTQDEITVERGVRGSNKIIPEEMDPEALSEAGWLVIETKVNREDRGSGPTSPVYSDNSTIDRDPEYVYPHPPDDGLKSPTYPIPSVRVLPPIDYNYPIMPHGSPLSSSSFQSPSREPPSSQEASNYRSQDEAVSETMETSEPPSSQEASDYRSQDEEMDDIRSQSPVKQQSGPQSPEQLDSQESPDKGPQSPKGYPGSPMGLKGEICESQSPGMPDSGAESHDLHQTNSEVESEELEPELPKDDDVSSSTYNRVQVSSEAVSPNAQPDSPDEGLKSPNERPQSPGEYTSGGPNSPESGPASPVGVSSSPAGRSQSSVDQPSSPVSDSRSPEAGSRSPGSRQRSPSEGSRSSFDRPSSPVGEPSSPKSPEEQRSQESQPRSPEGEARSPEEGPQSPAGEPMSLGEPRSPEGQPRSPESQPRSPESQPRSPESQPRSPESQPRSPEEGPKSPVGEPMSPEDQPR